MASGCTTAGRLVLLAVRAATKNLRIGRQSKKYDEKTFRLIENILGIDVQRSTAAD